MDLVALTPYRAIGAVVASAFLAAQPSTVYGRRAMDDYAGDNAPRALSQAYFAAVSTNQGWKVVSQKAPLQESADEESAYFTEDGGISIPPRAMIVFRNAGKCMDPHLPAPRNGEPMQFVNVGKLIPQKLRSTYDKLLERSARGDPNVAANNLQHLVWALRTAGTDDPIANNLSDSQIALLDECSGRRGTFLRYHERERAKNAKRLRREGRTGGAGRISVGGFSYDAADLRGTNGVRRIESHIATLTEMGEKATETTSSDFRYGEIEEELYSDIMCDGGLSFTARILNASERRREFRAADFAAQVGNGVIAGSRRQRVTMCVPYEFAIVMGALREGVEIDREVFTADVDMTARQRLRGRAYRKRRARIGEGHSRSERTREKTQRTRTDVTTTVEEILPVPPVPPVSPVVIHDTITNTVVKPEVVTNEVVRPVPVIVHDIVTNDIVHTITKTVAEEVALRVVSLEYDDESRAGVLTVAILRGSFKKATRYIRKNLDRLVRKESPAESAAKVPANAKLKIESISINEDDHCEVKFTVAAEGKET